MRAGWWFGKTKEQKEADSRPVPESWIIESKRRATKVGEIGKRCTKEYKAAYKEYEDHLNEGEKLYGKKAWKADLDSGGNYLAHGPGYGMIA